MQRSLHIQRTSHQVSKIVNDQPALDIIKVVDPGGGDPFPEKRTLIRLKMNEDCYLPDGAAGADRWWKEWGAWVAERSWAWGLECLNEPCCDTGMHVKRVCAFTKRWLFHLAQRHPNIHPVILNFSRGVPVPAWAPMFRQVIDLAWDMEGYIGFHEYWDRDGPLGNQSKSWLTFRFQRFFDALGYSVPSLITECGACAGDPHGWKSMGFTEEGYFKQMMSYCLTVEEIEPKVEAAFFFTVGGGDQWSKFELTENQIVNLVASNGLVTVEPRLPFIDPSVFPKTSDSQPTEPLPECETGPPERLAEKARWWNEEIVRNVENCASNAKVLRLLRSQCKLLVRLEKKLKDG